MGTRGVQVSTYNSDVPISLATKEYLQLQLARRKVENALRKKQSEHESLRLQLKVVKSKRRYAQDGAHHVDANQPTPELLTTAQACSRNGTGTMYNQVFPADRSATSGKKTTKSVMR